MHNSIVTMPNGDKELGDFTARTNKNWTTFVWVITQQCNLGCPYCVGFKYRGVAKSLVDTLKVDGIVSRFERLRDKYKKNIYITLTGGEPSIIKDFPKLCAALTKRKFTIELQTNLTTSTIKPFVDSVDPGCVGQIMASYHGWKLDKDSKIHDIYMENFKYATNNNILCVLKTIILPTKTENLQKYVSKLQSELPPGAPILTWVFIRGIPKSLKDFAGAYPYSYTPAQKNLIKKSTVYRKHCQLLYMNGAGFFKGMRCDAGRGFVVMDWSGKTTRCYTTRQGTTGYLGDFTKETIKINNKPIACPAKFCGTPFWGMWYGVDPWNYVPNLDKKNAYYCRFGPKVP